MVHVVQVPRNPMLRLVVSGVSVLYPLMQSCFLGRVKWRDVTTLASQVYGYVNELEEILEMPFQL